MQFKPGREPVFNKKVYRRAKITRGWYGVNGYKPHGGFVTDLEGNFNLMCASERAIRLLKHLSKFREDAGRA